MSLGILTNVAATYAENNLNQTQNSLQTVLQQLSSGSRINSGADDAAVDGPDAGGDIRRERGRAERDGRTAISS